MARLSFLVRAVSESCFKTEPDDFTGSFLIGSGFTFESIFFVAFDV